MPRIRYQTKTFSGARRELLELCNEILEQYAAQNIFMTLRQLYYQLVARAVIPNTERSYKNLGTLVNDARMAGELDWDHIQDLTRELRRQACWDSPVDILEACARQFRIDKWADQPRYVEVMVEKDALRNVIALACDPLQVPYFSCRGYTSQSEMWEAGQRFCREGQRREAVIIHLGDHDPSGIDMTRDIQERLAMFGANVEVRRIALNMDQIDQYRPPPNPAKVTDSRFAAYQALFGEESWELDALEPQLLIDLITAEVASLRDDELWQAAERRELQMREQLSACAEHWENVVAYLEDD